MRKRFLIALCFLPCHLFAGEITINKFLGLNTQDSTGSLPDGMSPDLLNVDLTPGGYSVKKRDGYGLYKTLTVSTAAVHGGHHFQDSSGNDIQLWGNDAFLSAIVGGATPIKVATGTLNSTWQCTDANGFAYCVTTNRDSPVKTDGTVSGSSYPSGVPQGTMVTSSPNRLFVAGVSGNTNTIYASEDGVFTNFTVALNDTSPYTEVIVAPGSRITHMRYACGKILWWKDQSFGYMNGDTQYTIEDQIVSPTIGTLDNSSAEYNSIVYFRGQDNHIYQYDCSNVTRLSREITPTVQAAGRRKSNSWTQTTAADFNAGSAYATYADTTSTPGSVNPTNFTDSFGTLGNWTNVVGIWTASGNQAIANATVASKTAEDYSDNPGQSDLNQVAWDLYVSMHFASSNLGGDQVKVMYGDSGFNGYGILYTLDGGGAILYAQIVRVANKVYTAISGQATVSTGSPYANHTFNLKRTSGGNFSLYIDGTVTTSSATDTTYASFGRGDLSYNYQGASAGSFVFNTFSVMSGTATYVSAVNNAPNLVTWGSFNPTYSSFGLSQSFSVRVATNPFSVLSATPAWVAQSPGSVVQTSTGTYFQMQDVFSSTSAAYAGQTPTMSDFTFNWFEGLASDKAYLQYFSDHVWVSVSSGTAGTNNRIQRLDLLDNAWLLDDITANGMVVDQGRLYFGDPSAGKIYLFGGALTSDNSAAINSYWKSKDYVGEDPWVLNDYVSADFIMKQASTTVTATYTVDTSTATSITLGLYDSAHTILRKSRNLAIGKRGSFYNVKISDNSINAKWELFGHRVKYNALTWSPN